MNRWTVIYDGECRLCRSSVARLRRWIGHPAGELAAGDADGAERLAAPDAVSYVPLQDPRAIAAAPGLDERAARARIHVVAPDGRLFGGAEALARLLLASRWRRLAWAYFLPGVRQFADLAYRLVAENRYRFGRSRHSACAGPCRLDPGPRE